MPATADRRGWRQLPGPGRRGLVWLALPAAAIWLAAGLTRIGPDPNRLHVRSWVTGRAQVLGPGWSVVPPLIAGVTAYPAQGAEISIRIGALSHEDALRSQEGAALFAAGSLRLQPDAARPDRLVRSFPAGLDESAGTVVAPWLLEGLGRHASGIPFTDLISGTGRSKEGVRDLIARDLESLGLRLLPGGTLKFYPAIPAASKETPRMEGKGTGRTRPRVLLIGLDGADWEIIDPLMRDGRMPHLRRLVESGARARLRTISPILSPIIWTSIATGVGPSRHGIMDFFTTNVGTGAQIPVTSNMRRVKALWNILTDAGISSGVVGWWATWPAEQVNGFMVSDRVSYQLFGYEGTGEDLRRRTYPEALGLAIQPLVVTPSQITAADVARFIEGGDALGAALEDHARRLRINLASSRTYRDATLDLMRAYDPDLKAVYFQGTDTIAHDFMRYRKPAMPGVSAQEIAALGEIVDRYYVYQDEMLGSVLALAGDETTVVICSDHGFRSGPNRPATDPRIEAGGAADWHRKFGILVINGPGIRKGAVLPDASVLDVTPTILALMRLPVAEDMEGRALEEAWSSPMRPERIASYESAAPAGSAEPIATSLDDEILARLKALGYVSQEGSNAMNNAGITLMSHGRYGEAAEAFRKAVRSEPRFVMARVNLGRAQMLMKDYDGALSTLQEAAAMEPSHTDLLNLIGDIHMERGDAAAAERHFLRALRLQPDDTDAHNGLGLLYERTGRDDLAIEHYRRVVAVDPDYAEGFNNIGLIHRKRGQSRRAIELFEQAIRADPEFAGSYNNMGLSYQDLGMPAEARAAYERGLRVDARNAVILNNLGTLDLAQHDLQAARSRFEQAIEADPEYASAYNNLGAVLGLLGQEPQAYEQYEKAVALDPNYTDARFNLALALSGREQWESAQRMLERVLAIDPHYGKAQLQLAVVLVRQGKPEEALESARAAAAALPASAEPQNLLADLYLSSGRTNEARRALQASLGINPDQPRVKEMLSRLR